MRDRTDLGVFIPGDTVREIFERYRHKTHYVYDDLRNEVLCAVVKEHSRYREWLDQEAVRRETEARQQPKPLSE